MNIIVCVDDNNGLLFNHRRQSRDIKVIERIYGIVEGRRFLIHSFSEKLFSNSPEVNDCFLDIAQEDDYCFIENVDVSPCVDKIKRIYLFRWNRKYPCDFTFDIDLEKDFVLTDTEDIKGKSHDNITMEVWTR